MGRLKHLKQLLNCMISPPSPGWRDPNPLACPGEP